jgi:hypothetical protein
MTLRSSLSTILLAVALSLTLRPRSELWSTWRTLTQKFQSRPYCVSKKSFSVPNMQATSSSWLSSQPAAYRKPQFFPMLYFSFVAVLLSSLSHLNFLSRADLLFVLLCFLHHKNFAFWLVTFSFISWLKLAFISSLINWVCYWGLSGQRQGIYVCAHGLVCSSLCKLIVV